MNRLKRFAGQLARSYRLHHEGNPSLLQWIGVMGVIAFSTFYLMRLTGKLPPRWNDVYFRVPAILSCLVLALHRWWPQRLVRHFLPYSWVTTFYCLAFFMPLTLLENNAAPNTVVNMMVGTVLVILLTDWRNTLVMVLGGYTGAAAWFFATQPRSQFPVEFIYWWVPLCLVLVGAGSISKYVERRAELERLRRLYSGLAGSIAHELRNPMSQVQHALESAESMLPRTGNSELVAVPRQQVQALSRALDQGSRAVQRGLQAITITLQQVNGKTLDTSRFTRLSAGTCVEKAVAEYAYETPRQRDSVVVNVVEDFPFRGEETTCVLVLFNLLKNALYYLPLHPGASITVSVESRPVHRIVVRDTGPGIPAERLPDLFEEFHSFGKTEGTGLGLAFCKRAMTAFGGDIACQSVPGQFTEFTLTFPPAPDVEEPSEPLTSALVPADFGDRLVLVVDDSAFNRAIVRARLRELGLRVLEAEHGEEALRLIDDGARPAVALMDMEMPGLSGVETTQALRKRPPPLCAIPVLALSANDLPSWRAAAVRVGMDGYLTKPLQPDLLRSELARVLQVEASESEQSRLPPDSSRGAL